MTRLTLHLLGPMSATLESGQQVDFAYDKVRALLVWLAVEQDRSHPRARLAALLWPDKSESAARHSLSQAISSLRASLGDRASTSPVIQADRQGVRFNVDAGCSVDLLEFHQLTDLTDAERDPAMQAHPSIVQRLRKAVQLYDAPFLDGFSLADCTEFEDWQRSVSEAIRRQYATALTTLIQQLEARGDLNDACEYAGRLVDIDVWDEDSHRLRMRLLAASGHRAAAIRQYESCVEMLDRDLGLEPEPETVELARRIRAGLDGPVRVESRAHALQHPKTVPLPAPVTSIIGRDDEINEITAQFRTGDSRLVTLVGPGGIGKSRLALEIARSLQSELADGAYYVSLAGVQSPNLIATTILDATSAQVDPQADPQEQLDEFLRERQILLLLDNFEHLLEGALLVSTLLDQAPGLQVLVTSRERLSLTSESVYQVQGLSLPDSPDSPAIAVAGATRLFMLRARKHNASFLPRQEDAPAIARIAHLTEGMPLALELAAAWIPVLSPDDIADEIEQSLDFLAAEMRDLPERHRSVRAVVDRSWENLVEVEQRVFRRLSVFQGGFTRAAAAYVAGTSLPILSSLVSKSLLRRTDQGRYEIHELLRQYAADRLHENPDEANVVHDRFRDYFIGFVAVREEQLQTGAQAQVLTDIAMEMDNIRAAWHRAITTRDISGLNRSAHSLWLYYDISDRYSEGSAMMSAGHQALDQLESVPGGQQDVLQLARARLRSREAALGFRITGPDAIQEQIEEALDLISKLDEPAELGLLLNFMACAAHVRGDVENEERYLEESIEHFERAGHQWGVAYSRNDLGQLRWLLGDYHVARKLSQTALGILESLGDQRGMAFALRNLGIIASRLGDTDLALELLRRSVDVRRPIGNQWGTAESLNQIGVILRDAGQIDEAREHFREALQIAQNIRAMQLATEILQQYIPLLLDTLDEDRGVIRHHLPVNVHTALAESGVQEVSAVVDAVLRRDAPEENPEYPGEQDLYARD